MRSKRLTLGFCIFYIVMLTWIIVFKMQFSFATLPDIRNINLIPFGASLIVNGKLQFSEIFQNAAAFIPLGVFTHTLMGKRPFWKQALPIAAASLLFETAQYAFAIGASDITDLIANTAGGLLGIGIAAVIGKAFGEKQVKIINSACLVGAISLSALIGALLLANL